MNFLKKKIVVYNRKQIKKTIETMNNFYVYVHFRKDNLQPFYVGKGKGRRVNITHNRNKHWQNVVAKHGLFAQIMENNLTEEQAFEREKFYIQVLGKENLCNHTDGGEGISGYKHSAESIKKSSRFGEKNGMFGKTHTEEVRKILSKKAKGVNSFEGIEHPHALKVINIETGIIYPSIRNAAKCEKVNNNSLKKYLAGSLTNKTNLRYYQ